MQKTKHVMDSRSTLLPKNRYVRISNDGIIFCSIVKKKYRAEEIMIGYRNKIWWTKYFHTNWHQKSMSTNHNEPKNIPSLIRKFDFVTAYLILERNRWDSTYCSLSLKFTYWHCKKCRGQALTRINLLFYMTCLFVFSQGST